VLEHACRLPHLSVHLSVRWVNCGKMADWIWMAFGVVSGIGHAMGVSDGGGDRSREGAISEVNVGHPIATS